MQCNNFLTKVFGFLIFVDLSFRSLNLHHDGVCIFLSRYVGGTGAECIVRIGSTGRASLRNRRAMARRRVSVNRVCAPHPHVGVYFVCFRCCSIRSRTYASNAHKQLDWVYNWTVDSTVIKDKFLGKGYTGYNIYLTSTV